MFRKTAQSVAESRGRFALILAVLATGFTALAVTRSPADPSARPVVMMATFLIVCLGWTFGTPGFLRWSKGERRMLNSELVQLNQRRAAQVGFAIALIGLTVSAFQPAIGVSPSTMAIIALAAAIIGAALTFAWFEHASK